MTHNIDVLGCGVIYIDGIRVFGSKPYGLFSTVTWKATDEDLKRLADRCLEVILDRKTKQMANDLIRKSDVLETYADLYDIFDDNKTIQEELHKVFDKINNIPIVESSDSEKPNNSTISKMEQVEDEPQTCSVNGRPYKDCCNCEYFKCTADEPQTDYEKYLDKIRPHDPHKDWFEDEPQTERSE